MATDHNFRIKNGLTVGSVEVIDSSGKLTANAFGTNSNEKIEDVVADMITGATHSNITVTYDDTNGTLAFAAAAQYGDSDVESYLDTNGLTLPDNIKANFGADDDLEIYHSSSDGHSYIHHTKAAVTGFPSVPSDLILKGNNIRIVNEDGDNLLTATSASTGGTKLYHEGSQVLNTTSSGARVSGDLVVTGTIDANEVSLDNSEYIYLGTNDTMYLMTNGSQSYVHSGDQLFIRSNNLSLTNTGSNKYFEGISGGAATIYYNSAAKLATTNTGISVTGTISSGAITSTGSSTFTSTGGMDINLVANPPELNFEDTSSTSGTKRARWTLDSNTFSAQGLNDADSAVTHQLLNFNLSSGAATFGGTISSGAITSTGAISGTSLNTGQGANELYAMNQNVRTTDSPTFASLDVDGIIDNTYNNGNVAAPNNSDHTAGTRIKFYDGGSSSWYAMGIESNTLWFNSDNKYKWYEDSTIRMTLDGANLTVTGSVTASTINTGQGATEVHLMNQNVRTSDSPTFADLTVTGNLNITGDINSYNVTDLDVTDKTITVGVGGSASTNDGAGLVVDGASASILWENSLGQFRINKNIEPQGVYLEDLDGTVTSRFGIYGWGNELQFTKRNLSTNAHNGTLMSLDYSNSNAKFLGAIYPSGQSTNYVDSTRIANWQTAYGWGNHASAGYLTSSSTQSKYLRSDTTDVMAMSTTSEMLKFQNNTSGSHIQLGFQQQDTDGLHHRFYIKTYKGSASASGNVDLIVRGSGGSTTSDVLELHSGQRASWQGNDIFTDAYHPNADTLTTARTIAGSSFDGSANIDINYNNLTNKPTIPTNNNQLTNGAGYITDGNTNWNNIYGYITTSDIGTHIGKGTGNNYVASSTSTSNRGNYGEGVWAYSGYSSGSNRPFTYDATLQVMPNNSRGFEIAVDWVSQTSTPMKVRSLRDCCQGWSDWTTIWTSTTDGANSGLDADMLDGEEGSYYLNYNNFTNTPTIPTNNNQLTNGAGYVTASTSSLSNYLVKGGSWNASNMPGSRWGGFAVNGGEVVFQRDNPNTGQMSVMVDGNFYAGENNGFWSLYSGNNYNYKVGMTSNSSGHLVLTAGTIRATGEFCNSNYAQGTMQDGALNIGNTGLNYAYSGTTWASDVRAGIMANCSETFEFVVHDSGDSVDSFMKYNGSDFEMGNNIGWGTTTFTFASDVGVNGHIYGRSVNGQYSNLYRMGGVYFTWDSDTYGTQFDHSLTSSYGGTYGDDITLNSYHRIRMNIDSNNNNSLTTEAFEIGHNTTGTGNTLFRVDGNAHATLGYDGQAPNFKMIYDDNHSSGDNWDTVIQLGRLQDKHNGNGNYPTYQTGNGFGLYMQSNSDGAYFGVEEYNTGHFRPVIAWGDDVSDSPFNFKYNNGMKFQFTTDGNLTASGNVTAYSDIKLKDNIETIANPIEKVKALRGVSFNRNDLKDYPRQIGVIAQEVEKVLPEVVSYTEETDTKSVSYGNMVGLLIEAVKEQQEQIEELKSIINTLVESK